MTELMSVAQAMRKAAEATDPRELLELYESFEHNAEVVKAIINNPLCPDEIKKRYVIYALDQRLRTYANRLGPNGNDILDSIRTSLEAWQPVQRLAPIPDVDPSETDTMQLLDTAQKRGAIVLYGPPGTSKTFLARVIAKALTNGEEHRVEFVQFHASYSYEDFIEGIVPEPHGDGITYEVRPKVFKEFCEKAEQQASRRFVFIIDEINRADLSKVFGEVFTCLEYRGQPVHLLYSRAPFLIPSNVTIIGTMNTVDRSTTDLDFALRRRFYFFEVSPNQRRLEQVLTNNGRREIDETFKDALLEAFGKTQAIYPLGHAYFKDVTSPEELWDLWQHQLRPLLEQYFEFEVNKVRDIERLYAPIWNESAEAE